MSKILFILKKRDNCYGTNCGYGGGFSSGLFNSVKFIVDGLENFGLGCKIVEVVDNNSIDREVTLYKPNFVIIEALWVEPAKFKILKKLHPNVKWIIRIHSETPFIANEGVAMEWILKSAKNGVTISTNSKRMEHNLDKMFDLMNLKLDAILLPNYYPIVDDVESPSKCLSDIETLEIGCFGAIRPLKNQLIQAKAALTFAKKNGKKLNFHINGDRVENNGNNVLKNIRQLFINIDPIGKNYKLIEHGWLNHDDFIKLVRTMHLGLQVSFSETFNIVTADFVSQKIPVVVSTEIDWISSTYRANPTDMVDIMKKISNVFSFRRKMGIIQNLNGLKAYDKNSIMLWLKYFSHSK